jgi:hypothetical protein
MQLKGKVFAVSRMGSGSHLMSHIFAEGQGWELEEENLKVVGGLDGGIRSLLAAETDVFLWEKFTTKTYVDSGFLKRIGEFLTPWPCFVIAVRQTFADQFSSEMELFSSLVCQMNEDFQKRVDIPSLVSSRYVISLEDAREWRSRTTWATTASIPKSSIEKVVSSLYKLKLIPSKIKFEELCLFKDTF